MAPGDMLDSEDIKMNNQKTVNISGKCYEGMFKTQKPEESIINCQRGN